MFEWLFNSIRDVRVCVCVLYIHACVYVHKIEVDACMHACVGFCVSDTQTDTNLPHTQTCECGLCLVWPLYLALLPKLMLCPLPIP